MKSVNVAAMIALSVTLFGLTPTVFAEGKGGIDGGGGKVVVCTKPGGGQTVELLDLWEARVLYGRTLNPNALLGKRQFTVDGLVEGGIDQLKYAVTWPYQMWCAHGDQKACNSPKASAEAVQSSLRNEAQSFTRRNDPLFQRPTKWLHNVKLNLTPDSYEDAIPRNCEIEQVVNYKSEGTILIDADLFDKLDTVNQAALILHESFYRFMKETMNESNSVRSRRAVGYVMAGGKFERLEDLLPARRVTCKSPAEVNTGYSSTLVHFFEAQTSRDLKPSTDIYAYIERVDGRGTIGQSKSLGWATGTRTFAQLAKQYSKTEIKRVYGYARDDQSPVDSDTYLRWQKVSANQFEIEMTLSAGSGESFKGLVTCDFSSVK